MPSWPWNKKKKNPEDDGTTFHANTVLGRLEQEGFKPLIKADILENRLKEIRETLEASLSEGDLGCFVDSVYKVFFSASSAWFRSMENKFLAKKVNAFLKRYNMERGIDSPVALRILVREGLYLINLAFAGLDVTPLTPIIIQTQPQYGMGFGGGATIPTSGGRTSKTYDVERPREGPFPETMSNKVKERDERK